MNFLALARSAFEAVAAVFGFAKQREELKNTPEMKANQVASADASREKQIAAEENAADAGALDALRKDLGE